MVAPFGLHNLQRCFPLTLDIVFLIGIHSSFVFAAHFIHNVDFLLQAASTIFRRQTLLREQGSLPFSLTVVSLLNLSYNFARQL